MFTTYEITDENHKQIFETFLNKAKDLENFEDVEIKIQRNIKVENNVLFYEAFTEIELNIENQKLKIKFYLDEILSAYSDERFLNENKLQDFECRGSFQINSFRRIICGFCFFLFKPKEKPVFLNNNSLDLDFQNIEFIALKKNLLCSEQFISKENSNLMFSLKFNVRTINENQKMYQYSFWHSKNQTFEMENSSFFAILPPNLLNYIWKSLENNLPVEVKEKDGSCVLKLNQVLKLESYNQYIKKLVDRNQKDPKNANKNCDFTYPHFNKPLENQEDQDINPSQSTDPKKTGSSSNYHQKQKEVSSVENNLIHNNNKDSTNENSSNNKRTKIIIVGILLIGIIVGVAVPLSKKKSKK